MNLFNFSLALSMIQAQSAVLSYLDDAVGIGEVQNLDDTRVQHGALNGECAGSQRDESASVSGAAQLRRSVGGNALEVGVTAGETALSDPRPGCGSNQREGR